MNRFKYIICSTVSFILGVIVTLFHQAIPPEATGSHLLLYDDIYFNDTILEKISKFHQLEKLISSNLVEDVRLLCWVMHRYESKENRRAIIETWGRRCNHLLFVVGSQSIRTTDEPIVQQLAANISIITFKMEDEYRQLWTKTKLAFKYITIKYKDQFDWVYKVDDDSYVVVENLKLFLKSRNSLENTFYGCRYKSKGGFNSGGPGYVMSSRVAEIFVSTLTKPACSGLDGGAEDVNVGKCLGLTGIKPADTRDTRGRYRFFPLEIDYMIDFNNNLPKKYDWWYSYVPQQMKQGLECCSDSGIAFHYVTASNMRMLEYLIYYLHPFTDRT